MVVADTGPLWHARNQDPAEGLKAVGPDTAAGARLEGTRAFFEYLLQEVPRLLERWRARRLADRAQ
jgi:hypothetical protein